MESRVERKGLGQVIKALREMNEMSRNDLAMRARLGIDMIAKIEQGAKSPSTRSLNRIAEALGVDTVELAQRGASWASLLGSGGASSAVLRNVASGADASASIFGRSAGSLMSLGLGAQVFGAGVVPANHQAQRRKTEMALRIMLDERLATASDEDLGRIATALSNTDSGSPPASE